MAGRFLTKRGGIWTYVRRVPDVYAQFDRRVLVRVSTRIAVSDDPSGRRAARVATRINSDLETYWHGLLEGRRDEARQRYEAARQRSRAMGLEYVDMVALIADRSADELMRRIEALEGRGLVEDEVAVAGALGGAERPVLRLSGLLKEYERLEKDALAGMSENQMRKWRNPKKRAIENLIAKITDKPVTEITRNDALDFRDWWQEKVERENLKWGTANKDIGHLNRMLKTLDKRLRLGIGAPFGELRFADDDGHRDAFDIAFVQNNILHEGALAGLNPEARAALYIVVETGLRLSEVTNLTKQTIQLGAKVPHVQVRPDGRRMKTDQSNRDIPLVGVALAAASAFPDGFPRYRDKPDSFSAVVNKYLAEHNLLPSDNHSAYSLRHTFEDRLTAVEAPEKVIASLMGHKWIRPKYGAGPSLEQKRQWLKKIAFNAPATV
ncbi:integrase [Chelatococcus caeni]|uniref:Integrase n=1 Tax=Chelatococcus caeni TaxID=1348468 RepID=A0A840BX61_9HYPH|nr:tyrosine-type recombinase/integrase [Chelatococcus caeni]MBB4016048.1 integrase [Chelatococcus caeni]